MPFFKSLTQRISGDELKNLIHLDAKIEKKLEEESDFIEDVLSKSIAEIELQIKKATQAQLQALFLIALRSGDEKLVEIMLNTGAIHVNEPIMDDYNPLQLAVRYTNNLSRHRYFRNKSMVGAYQKLPDSGVALFETRFQKYMRLMREPIGISSEKMVQTLINHGAKTRPVGGSRDLADYANSRFARAAVKLLQAEKQLRLEHRFQANRLLRSAEQELNKEAAIIYGHADAQSEFIIREDELKINLAHQEKLQSAKTHSAKFAILLYVLVALCAVDFFYVPGIVFSGLMFSSLDAFIIVCLLAVKPFLMLLLSTSIVYITHQLAGSMKSMLEDLWDNMFEQEQILESGRGFGESALIKGFFMATQCFLLASITFITVPLISPELVAFLFISTLLAVSIHAVYREKTGQLPLIHSLLTAVHDATDIGATYEALSDIWVAVSDVFTYFNTLLKSSFESVLDSLCSQFLPKLYSEEKLNARADQLRVDLEIADVNNREQVLKSNSEKASKDFPNFMPRILSSRISSYSGLLATFMTTESISSPNQLSEKVKEPHHYPSPIVITGSGNGLGAVYSYGIDRGRNVQPASVREQQGLESSK